MKIAAYVDTGVMEIREIPTPEPKDNEVLVKVSYCGICGSDIHQVQYGLQEPDNIRMGHEGCGVVAEVGKKVEGWRAGDRVIIIGALPCGQCWYCTNMLSNMCRTKSSVSNGRYAEYVVAPPNHLYPVPDEVSLKAAALWNPLSNAIHAVQLSRQRLGDFVVVLGAGPIGLLTMAAARRAGASVILATEVQPKRVEAARRLGAHRVLDPLKDDVMQVCKQMREVGADVVYECAGGGGTLQEAIRYARAGGQIVLVGIHMESFEFNTIPIEMLRDGTVECEDVVSSVIPLDRLPEMMKTLFGPNEEIKVLVEP
jgi:(R,R)-butanediol dehydrogenase/meso-butanediol dehydrogenase/diacetyl reductase